MESVTRQLTLLTLKKKLNSYGSVTLMSITHACMSKSCITFESFANVASYWELKGKKKTLVFSNFSLLHLFCFTFHCTYKSFNIVNFKDYKQGYLWKYFFPDENDKLIEYIQPIWQVSRSWFFILYLCSATNRKSAQDTSLLIFT